MAELTFTLTGSFLGERAEMALRVLGGPLSFRFTVLAPISLSQVWESIRRELEDRFGVSLPAIPDGPWSWIFNTKVTISFWVTPTKQAGGVACYLELGFETPVQIGGSSHLGPVEVTLEPDISVLALYLSYDKAQGGLGLRAKIAVPTTTGRDAASGQHVPGPPKTQLVTYPFPLPPQNSVGVFRLHYLGIGQRVGPDPVVDAVDPLAAIFDQLESQLVGSNPTTILTHLAKHFYKPDRGWFIAAHISLRGFDLRVLFNDPAMYGLEVTVATAPLTPLSGLLFEILYQKLSPNLGVYYGALTLPAMLRRIPLYAGIYLILPGFSIWIYTNGDFKVSVGWPLGDSSIGIQIGILVGQAGFYFAKLRSGDDPGAQPSEQYNPILAFGIGVRVYVSVGFNASIFSAMLSVTLSATMQGVLAWTASGGSATRPPDHVWFAGTAGLAVLIQGSVDFSILKASVVISFDAQADAAFETDCTTVIHVSASVSVRVSVKVVFFTIHLSFSTSVEHSFTIGDGPVASIDGPIGGGLAIVRPPPAARAIEPPVLRAARRLLARAPRGDTAAGLAAGRFAAALAGAPPRLATIPRCAPIPVHFVLQPTVTYGEAGTATISLIATLLMDCPPPDTAPLASPGEATGFEVLVVQLARWLVEFTTAGRSWEERFAELISELGEGAAEPGPAFGGLGGFRAKLADFLAASIRLRISGAIDANEAGTAAMLPMLDVLELTYLGQDGPGEDGEVHVDFGSFDPPPPTYPAVVDAYFARLGLTTEKPAQDRALTAGPGSMAGFLEGDYFLLLCRQMAKRLKDAAQVQDEAARRSLVARSAGASGLDMFDQLAEHVAQLTGPDAFAALLDAFDYAGTAGIVSNLMLRGLQLPTPDGNLIGAETAGLSALTGQQFAAPVGATFVRACLLPSTSNPPGRWIEFADGSPAAAYATIDLPASIPPMPDPAWYGIGSPDAGGGGIEVAPLPPLMPVPVTFSLKDLTAWTAPEGARTIYRLPSPLLGLMAARTGLSITLDEHAGGSPPAPAQGRAALLIRLTINQVEQPAWANIPSDGSPSESDAGGGAALAWIYQLNGTDEPTRDLLTELLLTGASQNARITLLYAPPGGDGLRSEALSPEVLLVRTNLSTLNQAPSRISRISPALFTLHSDRQDVAPPTDPAAFLRLVWEVSVVQAPGFFLFYRTADGKGLPAELFADSGAAGGSPGGSPGGRGPVPGTSRGTAAFAILVEFGEPAGPVALRRGCNSVVVDAANQGTPLRAAVLDDAGAPVPQYSPSLPPGHIGFDIGWEKQSSPRAQANDIPVEELYHLLQYAVLQVGSFASSVWSLPVGPTEAGHTASPGSPSGPWQYRQVIPVCNFLAVSPTPESPFAVVGLTAEIGFRLIDLYGDALPVVHDFAATPLYNDPIVILTEWPGLAARYSFDAVNTAGARLVITAEFDPTALAPIGGPSPETGSPEGADWRKTWQSTRQRYRLIGQQLADPNLALGITCSLSAAATLGDPKPKLVALIHDILTWIDQILAGSGAGSPGAEIGTSFSVAVPFAAVQALTHDIVALTATIEARRPAELADPAAPCLLPSVITADCVLAPDLDRHDPVSPGRAVNGLQSFARRFEAAFQGFDGAAGLLKLAQRAGANNDALTKTTPNLWAVRWSATAGIQAGFTGELAYFALAPLDTAPYGGTAGGRSYSGIDLNAWAQTVLQTLDGLLSPQMGVAISLVDGRDGTGFLSELIGAKRTLANVIPTGLTHVFADAEGGDLTGAQKRLEQALLLSLSNAFAISTVVQACATVSVVGSADDASPVLAPELYGPIGPLAGGTVEARQFSLTTATLPIAAGSPWLTTLLSVANPSAQANLHLPLVFQPAFVQHNFDPGDGYDGYVPSSWLKFALPGGMLDLAVTPGASPPTSPDQGVAIIPVPLPFRPQSPVLTQQSAFGAELPASPDWDPTSPSSPDNVAAEIAAALRWTYEVSLSTSLTSQDQLFFDAIYNGRPPPPSPASRQRGRLRRGSVDPLFRAMAAFLDAVPPLLAELTGQLGAIFSPGSPSMQRAAALLGEIVPLATEVANAWPTTARFMAHAGFGGEMIIDRFRLDPPLEGAGPVWLAGRREGGGNPEHWPAITGRSAGTAWRWQPDRDAAHPEGEWWVLQSPSLPDLDLLHDLTLCWSPLNVMQYQSGCLSASVARNAELVEERATNPDFIYTTPTVAFLDPLIPRIVRNALPPIIPAVGLRQMIEDILDPIARLGTGTAPRLQFRATYSYALPTSSGGVGFRVPAPVLLANDIALPGSGSPPTDLAARLARQIAAWYIEIAPAARAPVLDFGVTLFGAVGGEQKPLVQLKSIPVLVGGCAPEWWSAAL